MGCLVLTILRTHIFDAWLSVLKDIKGKARILARIDSAACGNFGDCKPITRGVSEMRVHYGPGYRIYFMRSGTKIYLLLTGGSKATQKKDIARALELAAI